VKATARRATTAVAVVLVGVGATQTWAAVEHLSASQIGARTASVGRCDSTPANWTYGSWVTTAAGIVTGVTVTNLSTGCNGGAAKLTLLNSSGSVVGSGGASVANGTFTVTAITGAPALDTIAKAAVLVSGP